MDQILHIFKKDARRHWPEILVSLALLALFTRHELNPWPGRREMYGFSFFALLYSGRIIIPALVISWLSLILRVIQSETLVGDRQWWVTKPYEWWKLLLAKLLFIVVFINVPLYHAQLFLLHKAGFPVIPYLWKVVLLQLSIPCALILFMILLACLTRNLGQALLTLGILLAVVIFIAWISSQMPDQGMHRYSELSQGISDAVLLGTLLFAVAWQFARRRTWQSRGLICLALLLNSGIGGLLPENQIERISPLISLKDAPVQVSLRPFELRHNSLRRWDDPADNVTLALPVNVSGVAPGTLLSIDGVNVKADSPDASHWSRGWKSQSGQIWTEDERKTLYYVLDRKAYEEYKSTPYNLQIEIAFLEYQAADARVLDLASGAFRDQTLGNCRLNPVNDSEIQCLKPIQGPGFMARFDAASSPCMDSDDPLALSDRKAWVAYAWQAPHTDYLPDSNLSSVADYNLWFTPVTRHGTDDPRSRLHMSTHLCRNDQIWLARPVFKRQFRIHLELPNTRLLDLAEPD